MTKCGLSFIRSHFVASGSHTQVEKQTHLVYHHLHHCSLLLKGSVFAFLFLGLEAAVLVFNQYKIIECPHIHQPGEMSHLFPGVFKRAAFACYIYYNHIEASGLERRIQPC